MEAEKGSKYGKVLYQHYFTYILYVFKIYLKKTRNLKKIICVRSEAFYFILFFVYQPIFVVCETHDLE